MKNSEKLLYYLYQRKNWVKSSELSDYLSISKRQVRKYIASLNDEFEVILSSPLGYKINEKKINKLFYKQKKPKTEKENRQKYIIQKLLSHKYGYDLFDLADELYVSETTIKKDIHELRFFLQNFMLKIIRKKNVVSLVGNEKSKRELIFNLVTDSPFDISVLNQELSFYNFKFDYEEILTDLKENLLYFNFSLDDFTLISLAIQYLILLERIRCEQFLEEIPQGKENIQNNYSAVMAEINLFFEKKYKIHFNESEQINSVYLIQNHINETGNINFNNLNHYNLYLYVDYKYIEISKKIIKKAEYRYGLAEFSDNFGPKFALYVQNLFLRHTHSLKMKNPLNRSIRLNYPLIYDISSFLFQELKSNYHLSLIENDLNFLALHIGSYFEEKSYFQQTKVNCVFIYLNYYDFYKITLNKINLKLNNKINIVQVISICDFKKITTTNADLLLLPNGVNINSTVPAFSLDLFPAEEDYTYLEEIINKISAIKKQKELKRYISDFFHKNLFFKNPSFHTKSEILKEIFNSSASLGLVEKSLYQEILKNEIEIPTIFQNIAVPHSLDTNKIYKSFIAVALFEKGILWADDSMAYLVFFIGIDQCDQKKFSKFYDCFIKLFDYPAHVQKLLKSTDYDDFIQIMHEIFFDK